MRPFSALVLPQENTTSPINFTGIPYAWRNFYANAVRNQKNSSEPKTNKQIRNFINLFRNKTKTTIMGRPMSVRRRRTVRRPSSVRRPATAGRLSTVKLIARRQTAVKQPENKTLRGRLIQSIILLGYSKQNATNIANGKRNW